jgi:hypothetical protein
LLLPTCLFAQDTTGAGSISGAVLGADGRPAAQVKVCVAGTSRCAVSSESGAFSLPDLRAGGYALEVAAPGQPSFTSAAVEVRAGLESRVEIALPAVDAVQQSITVSESFFVATEEVKNSAFLVRQEEVFKAAGALQDVARYVQTLPGVALGTNDLRNDIIVRGGSPLENLFIVDNIEIPNINAFANLASAGGTVSILDALLLQDVTFLTGGYPAPFINRTSGVLQVTQREGDRERFGGRATMGFAGAGTVLEGPIGRAGKGSWITSVRRSFLDFFTDDIGFGGVPVFYTYNAKALYDLSSKDRLWVVNVSGNDRIRLGAQEGGDVTREFQALDIRTSGWRSASGLNWQRLFNGRTVGLFGLTHSESRVFARVRDLFRNGMPPPWLGVEEQIALAPEVFREASREGESTIKYDLTSYSSMMGKIQAGGSFKLFNTRYDTASPFGRDNPFSLVRNVNPFSIDRRIRATQTGAYLQTSRNFGSRWGLTLGGRYDHYQFLGASRFSPRAGLSFRITEKLSWRSSYGQYFQQPFFLFLAVFPENRGTIPWRADHYVSGLTYVINPTFRVVLEGYSKRYKDYPVATQFPQLSLANVGDTFDVSSILFPLTSAGRGRVDGVELYAEKKSSGRWFGQANVAWQRARQAGLDGIMRPASFEYPWIFNAVGGARVTGRWEASVRVAYLAGRPFTPFDAAESSLQRRGIFDLERVNAERLPHYFRLDVRVDRTYRFRGKDVLVFIGIQNVTNRRNVSAMMWNRALNEERPGLQLGFFPLGGLDWRF